MQKTKAEREQILRLRFSTSKEQLYYNQPTTWISRADKAWYDTTVMGN